MRQRNVVILGRKDRKGRRVPLRLTIFDRRRSPKQCFVISCVSGNGIMSGKEAIWIFLMSVGCGCMSARA